MKKTLGALALAAAIGLTGPVSAQPAGGAGAPAVTKNLQGDETHAMDPLFHAFYDLTVTTFGKDAAKVDVAAYEQKSFALFRAFAASMGMEPEALVDHAKAIPRQMVKIVKDDPKVLNSYANFSAALIGPE